MDIYIQFTSQKLSSFFRIYFKLILNNSLHFLSYFFKLFFTFTYIKAFSHSNLMPCISFSPISEGLYVGSANRYYFIPFRTPTIIFDFNLILIIHDLNNLCLSPFIFLISAINIITNSEKV